MCVSIYVYTWEYLLTYILCLGEHLLGTKRKQHNESAFQHLVYFFLSFLCLNTVFSPFVQDVRFVISENVSKF